ncbi:MAG: tetratricopeptide repeat protein [Chitinispirillaceae bacterium]
MKNVTITRGLTLLICVLGFTTFSFGESDLDAELEALETELAETEGKEATEESASSEDAPYQMDSDEDAPYQLDSEDVPEEAPTTQKPASFSGTYKILISRPIYAPYNREGNTKWMSAIGEMFYHYKVGSFPRTYAFTPGQINGVLPNYRDYNKRISRQAYVDAAKKLGATHLLYQEYEPRDKGKEVRYAVELLSLAQNGTVIKVNETFESSDFEKGLDKCLAPVAEAMDQSASSTTAYSKNLFGKKHKSIKKLGEEMAQEGAFNQARASETFSSIEKLVKKNKKHIGYQYSAAAIAARAGEYDKAIEHMDRVISESGDYPALHLLIASYYRNAERYSEALNAAQVASNSSSLTIPVAKERAMIYQKQGKLNQAREQYNTILDSGEADGSIYFRLALLSIQMDRMDEADDYINKAEANGLTLDQNQQFQLGQAYAELSGQEDLALEYLEKSLGKRQDNEEAWELMATIYKRMGNEEKAAKCYVSLFQLNNDKHKDKLKMAGEMYEKAGNIKEAENAYALFIDRRYEDEKVRLSLGKIYFNQDNCDEAKKILKDMNSNPEAIEIRKECGEIIRDIDKTDWGPKTPTYVKVLRWTAVALAAGGAAGGYYFEEEVKKLAPQYNESQSQQEVISLREDIKSKQTMRTGSYALGGAALIGLTATFLF